MPRVVRYAFVRLALAFCRQPGHRPELAWSPCDYANMLRERDSRGDQEKVTQLQGQRRQPVCRQYQVAFRWLQGQKDMSIKTAFYLDPVTRDTGCLRVIPGSHHVGDRFGDALESLPSMKDYYSRPEQGLVEELWGVAGDWLHQYLPPR